MFGSHARGEVGEDSDLDLFVEMETDLRPPAREGTDFKLDKADMGYEMVSNVSSRRDFFNRF